MVETNPKAVVERKLLYTTRSLYYNNHYGRAVVNTSEDDHDNITFSVFVT